MALGRTQIVLKCTMGTHPITKVSIKNSAICLVRQVHTEEQGLWRQEIRVKVKVGDRV